MKFTKFFDLAKEKGLTSCQIQISRSKALAIKLFHHEIDNYSINDSQSVIACGIYEGKFGSASTEKIDKDTFEYLIDSIIENAKYNEKNTTTELFKGSDKYHKKNVFNKDLATIPVEEKLKTLHAVEDGLFAYSEKVNEVEEVGYKEVDSEDEFYNSFGLKLKQHTNYFYIYAYANAKDGESMKTAGDFFIDNNFRAFETKKFVDGIGKKLLAKFGGVQCESGNYPTVLENDVLASLMDYFLAAASSDEVQKKSSFLGGKLNTEVASSHVTIESKPLAKNIFFSYFDDEGVATQNMDIVKKGVLKNYFYNIETAKKDGVQSTGNGRWERGKIGIGFGNIFIKPSKKSFGEMVSHLKQGVFITEIEGLGTGMNEESGDFSCQAQGFMIREGQLAEPLNLITLSGNLLAMLKEVKTFDNAFKLNDNSVSCADVLIKKMAIGGK
jgi:PmbA protein